MTEFAEFAIGSRDFIRVGRTIIPVDLIKEITIYTDIEINTVNFERMVEFDLKGRGNPLRIVNEEADEFLKFFRNGFKIEDTEYDPLKK